MGLSFSAALLIFGSLLAVVAALSGAMRGTVLSASVLSLALGIVFAAVGHVDVDPKSHSTVELIELALALTLFSDGMFVERELLRVHRGTVIRALAVAMPLTLCLLALAAKVLFPDLIWAEAFLLGAVLCPTDPVVTSAVVTSSRVPASVRHTLNLESGLNDGLALPFVLFFLVLAQPGGDAGAEAAKLVGQAAVGGLLGSALGILGGKLHPRLPAGGLTARYEGIYAIGFALMSFGLAEVTWGNGLIAAFVCGIAMAAAEGEVPEGFVEFSEGVSTIFQILTFFVFGALIVTTGFHDNVPELIVFIVFALVIARPAAILISFFRTGIPRAEQIFMAWFGPKGVASMLFALLALKSAVPDRTLVFDTASIVIVASIVAHGLTDTIGAGWVARRVSEAEE